MENRESEQWIERFIHNVIWLRRHYGISKKKMAQLLGIGVGSLNKIEQGTIPPMMPVDVLIHIQENFGISPHRLLTQRLGD